MENGNGTLRSLWVLGHRVTVVPIDGEAAIVDVVTPPGVPGPPPHYHDDAAELFYVLEGTLEVMADGSWTTLGAGEATTVPRGVVHTFRNPTEAPVRVITTFEPHGFERFFGDLGVDASRPGAQAESVSEEAVGRVVAECAGYGMILAET